MNSTDIIGYVSDGAVYCATCTADRTKPYFVSYTNDLYSSLCCDNCLDVIWHFDDATGTSSCVAILNSNNQIIEGGFDSYEDALAYAHAEVGVYCKLVDCTTKVVLFEGTPAEITAKYNDEILKIYAVQDSTGNLIEGGLTSFALALEYAYDAGVYCKIVKYESDGSMCVRFEGTPDQISAKYHKYYPTF